MEVLKLRKNTGSPKETMWQTFRAGAFMAAVLFVVYPSIARHIEHSRDLSNSIRPEFHIVEGWDTWHVVYKAHAERPVRARFTIQTRTMEGRVLCTYVSESRFAYSANISQRRVWTWDGWAETHNDGSCRIPPAPFRVCLRYDGETSLGNAFDTPFTCRDFTQTTAQ